MSAPKIIFNIRFTPKDAFDKDERNFYSNTKSYNFAKYVGDKNKICKTYDRYDDYMNKCGHGFFNHKGVITSDEMKKINDRLALTDSNIWHGFISFDEETSKSFTTQKECIDFLSANFKRLFGHSRIDIKNIELLCGLHTDTENHHHIHFMFFEKEPKTIDSRGNISFTKKGSLDMRDIEDFLINGNMYIDNYVDDLYVYREIIVKELKIYAPAVAGNEEQFPIIAKKMKQLSDMLPKEGRLQYNSKNIDSATRKAVDDVVSSIILSSPKLIEAEKAWTSELLKREAEIKKICKDNNLMFGNTSLKPEEIYKLQRIGKLDKESALRAIEYRPEVISRLRNDFKARLGNIVIKSAVRLRDGDIESDLFKRRYISKSKNDKSAKINAKNERLRKRHNLLDMLRRFHTHYQFIKNDFTHDLEKSRQEIEREQQKTQSK